MTNGNIDTRNKLDRMLERMHRSGNPEHDFWYLGGKMSWVAKFNIPLFKNVADVLRSNGYNIISPNEIDDPEIYAQSMESLDGDPKKRDVKYERLLARDITIISMPACIGGIFIDGWQTSYGAILEKTVLESLNKPVYQYVDAKSDVLGLPGLTLLPTEDKTPISSPGAVEIQNNVKESDYAVPSTMA